MDKNWGIKYFCGNKLVSLQNCNAEGLDVIITDDGKVIEVTLSAKAALTIKSFDFKFDCSINSDDNIFCNGYQSWSLSREYKPNEKQEGLNFLGRLPIVKKFAKAVGDYSLKPKRGYFRSFTYGYLKKANEVFLIGSLSEDFGFTLIDFDAKNNSVIVRKDLSGFAMNVGQSEVVARIFYTVDAYEQSFDEYFKFMKLPALRAKRLKGYTSWYNYFGAINENIILRDLEGIASKDVGANVFQIDDGYQSKVGDWLTVDKQKFPNGMKYVADKIHDKNMLAGIWLAPFNCARNSKIAKQYPQYLLRDKRGNPIIGSVAWGGAYVLDLYCPGVRDYLKDVFKEVIEVWGFDMVKLDFLYSQCMIARNGKSKGQIMAEAMDFLRECVGDKLILGCGVPLGSAFGKVDYCRIGCDVSKRFKQHKIEQICAEIISTPRSMINSLYRRHLNCRAFISDPDVFFVRNDNLSFNRMQKIMLAKINNLCGDVLFVSDDVGKYDEGQTILLINAYNKHNQHILGVTQLNKHTFVVKTLVNGRERDTEYDFSSGRFQKVSYNREKSL